MSNNPPLSVFLFADLMDRVDFLHSNPVFGRSGLHTRAYKREAMDLRRYAIANPGKKPYQHYFHIKNSWMGTDKKPGPCVDDYDIWEWREHRRDWLRDVYECCGERLWQMLVDGTCPMEPPPQLLPTAPPTHIFKPQVEEKRVRPAPLNFGLFAGGAS